jgi:hypothetical protein
MMRLAASSARVAQVGLDDLRLMWIMSGEVFRALCLLWYSIRILDALPMYLSATWHVQIKL